MQHSQPFFNFSDVKSEKEILEYLKNGTLVGLLPVPHPIIIRKYQVQLVLAIVNNNTL